MTTDDRPDDGPVTDAAALRSFLDVQLLDEPPAWSEVGLLDLAGTTARCLRFASRAGGDTVPALLLQPTPDTDVGVGVVVHHQHAHAWHLGKSEVVGLAGDPVDALGLALCRAGLTVLTFDAFGFEDRRVHAQGTAPHPDDRGSYTQELTHRLVRGDTLNRLHVQDAADAVAVLDAAVPLAAIGLVGHSFGGHVTLFTAAADGRVAFAAASGCAGTIGDRVARGGGVGFDQVVPGIVERADLDVVAGLIAPRPLLLLAGDDDRYARDIDRIADHVGPRYQDADVADRFTCAVRPGGHALDDVRRDLLLGWVREVATQVA